jgi:hypothetical protein
VSNQLVKDWPETVVQFMPLPIPAGQEANFLEIEGHRIRIRVKGLALIQASICQDHDLNWRTHSVLQRSTLFSVLKKIGFVDVVLVYEREKSPGCWVFCLVDGHLRKGISGDHKIPALVHDLNDQEAEELLDEDKLKQLMGRVSVSDPEMQALHDQLKASVGMFNTSNPRSLTDLESEYGQHQAEDTWPTVKIRVPPETRDLYEDLMKRRGEIAPEVWFNRILTIADDQMIPF